MFYSNKSIRRISKQQKKVKFNNRSILKVIKYLKYVSYTMFFFLNQNKHTLFRNKNELIHCLRVKKNV